MYRMVPTTKPGTSKDKYTYSYIDSMQPSTTMLPRPPPAHSLPSTSVMPPTMSMPPPPIAMTPMFRMPSLQSTPITYSAPYTIHHEYYNVPLNLTMPQPNVNLSETRKRSNKGNRSAASSIYNKNSRTRVQHNQSQIGINQNDVMMPIILDPAYFEPYINNIEDNNDSFIMSQRQQPVHLGHNMFPGSPYTSMVNNQYVESSMASNTINLYKPASRNPPRTSPSIFGDKIKTWTGLPTVPTDFHSKKKRKMTHEVQTSQPEEVKTSFKPCCPCRATPDDDATKYEKFRKSSPCCPCRATSL